MHNRVSIERSVFGLLGVIKWGFPFKPQVTVTALPSADAQACDYVQSTTGTRENIYINYHMPARQRMQYWIIQNATSQSNIDRFCSNLKRHSQNKLGY